MLYHKTLDKQIHKTLSPEHLADPAIQSLLNQVSLSYNSFERDKKLSNHAYSVSEKEYQEVLTDLKVQNEINSQSVKEIKEAITSLDPTTTITVKKDDNELMGVITYLHKQIHKSKELENALILAKEQAE